MKKIIIWLLVLLLGGCSTIERFFLRDTKKPEKNVLPGLVSGTSFSELDFTNVFPNLSDPKDIQIDAFFADGNLLYFSLSTHSDSAHPNASISTGIYAYNFASNSFVTIFAIDPSKKFFVSSIAVLRGNVYFSGGYPIGDKAGECAYEISVIKGNKAVVLLKDTTYNLEIPKLLKFSDNSLVFLQTHYASISETEYTSSHKITQIRADASMRSSTEYGGTTNASTFDASIPYAKTFTLAGTTLAYAASKNAVALIYSATYDPITQKFKDLQLIKVGKNLSPETLVGFGSNWYVSSFDTKTDLICKLDVFDLSTGRKVATQIFANDSRGFGLSLFDSENGLFIGDFEKGDGPNGIGKLYLAHFEINSVKYQRIDTFTNSGWPISFVKLADKKYLVQGKLGLEEDLKYYILEFKE